MQSNAAVTSGIAEAERRVDAIEVLCSIIIGQAKAERRELQALRQAITSSVPGPDGSGQLPPGDISPEMLAG
jgi:hypothetical protein